MRLEPNKRVKIVVMGLLRFARNDTDVDFLRNHQYLLMVEMEMKEQKKIEIIICDRYRNCGGDKCLRALNNRDGAFSIYEGQKIELVGYTTCGGCPRET
jgi:hypothetical protein